MVGQRCRQTTGCEAAYHLQGKHVLAAVIADLEDACLHLLTLVRLLHLIHLQRKQAVDSIQMHDAHSFRCAGAIFDVATKKEALERHSYVKVVYIYIHTAGS